MAHDLPDLPELVRTSRDFIARVTPKLDGEDRYHALCSTFLLEIVLRELEQWAPQATEDDERLRALLDDPDHPLDSLTADLSAAVRSGAFDDRMPELLTALIAHVESKVAVTKPAFLDDPAAG
ncbi:MAG: DUF6285 domain-containing protein [Gammaproteobacteria bacterium]|jgi:hypothetical protein